MEKIEFENRLVKSTKYLIDFTSDYVVNALSDNIEFLIEPSSRLLSNHLNDSELQQLDRVNSIAGKLLLANDTVDILFNSEKVPLWINMEVYRSSKTKTIIKLLCSRRLRQDKELNDKISDYPPFKVGIPLPPWYKKGKKFNINWRHQKMKQIWYAVTWKWFFKKKCKNKKPN